MSDGGTEELSDRVLILAPTARDAVASRDLLADAGIRSQVCASIADVCREAARGAGAGVVTAEAVVADTEGVLAAFLRAQPPWSDLPLIVLTPPAPDSPRLLRALESVGPMTLMKRPVQVSTLVSAVRTALRDRERQYAVRGFLDERERYRVTLASIGDAVIATDAGGAVTFLNPVAEALTGWPAAEAAGRSLTDIFPIVNETSRQPVENPALRALQRGAIVGLANHTLLIARDGTERPIDDSAAPIRDETGSVGGAVLVFRDISERKAAEEARSRLAETLGMALDAGELGTWEWDPATDGMVLSARAGEIYGVESGRPHPREQLRGLLHPNHRDRAREQAARAVTARTDYDLEYPLLSGRWVAARGRGVYDETGALHRMIGVVQDITARKAAEAAMRERDERLQLFVENATDYAFIISGPDDRAVEWLGGAERITGWSPAEALGQPLDVIFTPEDRAAGVPGRETAKAAATGRAENVRWHQRKDGSRFFAEGVTVGLRGPAGELRGFGKVFRDATDEKRAEAALRASEGRHRALVTATSDVVYRMSADWEVMHPIDGRDLIASNTEPIRDWMSKHIPAHEQPRVRAAIRRALESKTTFELEHQVSRPDGTLGWTFSRAVPILDAAGDIAEWFGTARDVTERKRAEGELRERDERLQLAVAIARMGTFEIDLATDAVAVNEPGRDIYGWADTRTTFARVQTHFHPADRDEVMRAVNAALEPAGAGVFEVEQRIVRADAAVRWLRVRGRALFDGDGATRRATVLVGAYLDVTDQKAAEAALLEADRKKDDFIALLAHELRNPLAPIRNGLQVLRLSQERAARERSQQMMDRQLSHMVRMIDDLLDVSRIGRNKMELRRARVALADVAGSAVETARPAIEEAGHELVVSLPPEPVLLDADLTRLSQVFSNLLTNSAKYTERGGKIWLTAESRDGAVVVTVRDSGIGIPADALPRIFDMFSQVDRSTERSTGGLGIGLALVKGLVEMHGGTVTARSDGQGRGSEFTVSLPALTESPAGDEPAAEVTPLVAGAKRRVLVVDDNRDGAESLAEMLLLLGNEVETAHDGLEAVDAAERFRPEAILMDVGMPRLNGLDATRRIRERPWGRRVTIIALTGWGQDADRERTRVAGCDGHLVKPVSLSDLEKLLSELDTGGA